MILQRGETGCLAQALGIDNCKVALVKAGICIRAGVNVLTYNEELRPVIFRYVDQEYALMNGMLYSFSEDRLVYCGLLYGTFFKEFIERSYREHRSFESA